MPSSYYNSISEIMSNIVKINPQRVLDIGPGFGKYGVLCREYLEYWYGNENYSSWNRTIDCVEAYEKYTTCLHEFIYNNVYIGDATNIIDKLERYNLILVIDVIEHFEKNEGKAFINQCLNVADYVLISTPIHFIVQNDDFFENKYECHKSIWTKQELKKCGYNYFTSTDESYLIVLSNNKKNITDVFMGREDIYWIYQNEMLLSILRPAYRMIKRIKYLFSV